MKLKYLIITGVILLISSVAFSQKIEISTSAQCEMCKDRIENELVFTKGVKDAVLDMDTKVVTVTYKTKKITEQEIIELITDLGYDAAGKPGNQDAYADLPNCCKKPKDRL